jgi:hypothetical protein
MSNLEILVEGNYSSTLKRRNFITNLSQETGFFNHVFDVLTGKRHNVVPLINMQVIANARRSDQAGSPMTRFKNLVAMRLDE